MPGPALVERFRRDLEAITGTPPTSEARLGLAVSGGGDSLALLLLAATAYPGAVCAATVDHGLRPDAAREATQVHHLCADMGIEHAILGMPPRYSFAGNIQDRARVARYAALELWAGSPRRAAPGLRHADWVAVAHQRDDVAEALLMRARRGAGVGGLAEMVRQRPFGQGGEWPVLIRPLLGWSRSELAAIVAAAGIGHAEDPSNSHPRFDRSRMRAILAVTPELPASRLALAARNLRHAEDAIEWMVRRELKTRVAEDENGGLWLDARELPYELRRRFVRRAIEGIRQENGMFEVWSATGLDRLVAALDSGKGGTLADVQARILPRGWHFRLAPPRR
ncbi:tRNA lysidine(34) synthetase TilS [Sphingomonas alpina]|uniref:tRNA(Ile)-lysidine synthase n=2 Tax=Sphingomonas alpina TaxID=653931 RepID=A0A7H0LR92_9SPHN|nr:tRNA lysidine(34) synthetase TilS [Sphingomonas alpina]